MNQSIKEKLPIYLIYSRLYIGFITIGIAFFQPPMYQYIIISLLTIGLFTDIFDGILARRFKVSTEKLRRLDSTIDQIFWISALIASVIMCFDFWKENFVKLIIVLSLEAIGYVVSFIRFKKEIATHALIAKFWAITVLAALVDIILHCSSPILFNICVITGIVARIEIIAIMLTIKEWTNDIPTIYHAYKLRKGQKIKRFKIFNG